jgi:putative photosynthetic complex assembly protein 2
MSVFIPPVLFVLFVWWFSTGVVLYLNNLPKHTYKWSLLGATVVLVGSIYGLTVTSQSDTLVSAYLSFTFGLLAWAWTQFTFYTGMITGPRTTPCPSSCAGPRHFWHAVETSMYHEIFAALLGIVICFSTMNGQNHVGSWTYTIIWLMHTSAKLNAVLGARNLNEHFFPEQLRYLSSFITKRPMNLLFPISVTVATVAVSILMNKAMSAENDSFDMLALTFYITILALGILEHWFMMLPLPSEALWNWAVKAKEVLSGREDSLSDTPAATQQPARARAPVVAGQDI